MSPRYTPHARRTLATEENYQAYLNFVISRKAKRCTQSTVDFYDKTAHRFLLWAEDQGIKEPGQITAMLVRQYLNMLVEEGKKDTTVHAYARAIKTMMHYFHTDEIVRKRVVFDMPKLEKKRLPVLDAEELRLALSMCNTRDKALVMFMADCGIRCTETCNLNWGDVNMLNGLVKITQGKGQKDRAVVVGAKTRQALLRYRRTLKPSPNDKTPLFQSRTKARLTRTGVLIIYRRLSKKTGLHITPHAMRRTFVILSLRNNVDPGHIQAMLGHTDLSMVYYYAQLENEDLIRAFTKDSPVDGLF
jgi:Site-specific recombinase XerD